MMGEMMGEMMQVYKTTKDYEIVSDGFGYATLCKHCRHKEPFKLDADHKLMKMMKIAGGEKWHALSAYIEHEKGDEMCFCGWRLSKCHLCGEDKVIGYDWQYYSTGPDYNIVHPSTCMRIPYDTSTGGVSKPEIHICAFCIKKSKTNPTWYFKRIADIIKSRGASMRDYEKKYKKDKIIRGASP